MRTLYLMRHATAAASGPDGTDHSRPLTQKGRQEAETIGKFLRRTGVTLDGAACSTATRALETAELVLSAAGSKLRPTPAPELYNGTGGDMLRWIQGCPVSVGKLLLVAHMPSVAELLSLLATESADLAMGFSPGTLTAIEADAERWSDWNSGCGLLQLVLPAAHA